MAFDRTMVRRTCLVRMNGLDDRPVPRRVRGRMEREIVIGDWTGRGAKGPAGTMGIDNESDQVREGHLVDALALRGDEGRGTLR